MRYEQAAVVNRALRGVGMAHRSRAAALLATIGLNIGQEILLLELAGAEGRSQAQLASAAGCQAPTITMAVRKLEAAGFVQRTATADDARVVIVRLTDEGAALIPRLHELWCQLAEESVAQLSATDRNALLRMLTRVSQALEGPKI